jgi:dethiobiotin synthetase
MPSVFITGTDTDCGKTHVATALLHALRARGLRAVAYKPIAAGCRDTEEGWRNDDAEKLLAASAPGFSYAQVNPVALKSPIAPHLAAQEMGLELSVGSLLEAAEILAARSDWLVVEGAGGFLVPLNAQETMADLPAKAGWPVILVVGMRLGCINHALLSVEAISKRAKLLGWVANVLPPEQSYWQDNIECLRARIAAPCLGVVTAADPLQAAEQLNLAKISDIFS